MSARRSSLTTPAEILFRNADTDGDNALSLSEFTALLPHLANAIPSDDAEAANELRAFISEIVSLPDEIAEVFRELNKSKSGFISLDEFKTCEFFEKEDD